MDGTAGRAAKHEPLKSSLRLERLSGRRKEDPSSRCWKGRAPAGRRILECLSAAEGCVEEYSGGTVDAQCTLLSLKVIRSRPLLVDASRSLGPLAVCSLFGRP